MKLIPASVLLVTLCSTAASHGAALLGIAAPSWDRTASNAGHAAWEWWNTPTGQFSGLAADQSLGTTSFSPGLTQTNSTVGLSNGANTVTGQPGRLTSGGVGSQYQFTISDTALAPISTILIQIKHSNFLDAEWAEVLSPFTVSVDGGNAVSGVKNPNGTTDPESYRWSSSDGGTATGGTGVFFWTYSYEITGLDIAEGETYSVDFSSLADTSGFGFSVDTVSMDVLYGNNVIPEPSAALLAASSIGLGCFNRRRGAVKPSQRQTA